jgi:lipopolysaccharide/colanic/teichoic acid biosynthesis glycosyltransferase
MNDFRGLRNWILASDLGWLVVSMIVACLLRYGTASIELPRSIFLAFSVTVLGAALVWTILWSMLGLDGFGGGWRFPAIVSQLVLGTSIVMATVLAAGYLLRIYVSRLLAGYFAFLMVFGFILIRIAAHSMLTMRYRAGAVRRVVIVGSGPVAQEAAAKIQRHPEALCAVVGFLAVRDSTLEVLPIGATQNSINVRTCGIMDLLAQQKVDELIFAAAWNGNPEVAELIDQSVKRGLAVSVIPQPYELYLTSPELIDLDGLPILRLRHSVWTSSEPIWKRVLDLALGTALLIPSLPVIVAAVVLLRVKKGQAFCQEKRCGKGGRPFWMYRLNSPRRETDLPIYERIMQHLSITELPQLLNVLRGDMSLVGPRPEVLESVRHYTDWHLHRLNVKPGITGLAQVHGLRDQNALEDKTRYDLQYILRRSLFHDISLLLQTIWTIFRRFGHVPKPSESETVQQNASTSSMPI